MIERLRIENYQSHEKTDLEFHPGVNTIIGSSNSGKSAILRALYWLIYNKPDGFGFASHWILNEKGNLHGEVSVEIYTPEFMVITRKRNPSFNGYYFGEMELKAIGREVPEEISNHLRLVDVNIQRQLDAHYLLSESAGAVAKLFNQTLHLDSIDQMLSLVESKKRKTRGDISSIENQIQDWEIELESLEWTDKIDLYVTKAEGLEEKNQIAREKKEALSISIIQYQDYLTQLESIQLEKVEEWLVEAQAISENTTMIKINLMRLRESLLDYKEHKDFMGQNFPIIGASLNKVESLYEKTNKEKSQLKDLRDTLEMYWEFMEKAEKAEKESLKLLEELPEICPECGSVLISGGEENE